MIDIAQPVDYGSILESIPNSQSTQALQQANTNLANAQIPGVQASTQAQQLQNSMMRQRLQMLGQLTQGLSQSGGAPIANDSGATSAAGYSAATAPSTSAQADPTNPAQPGSPAAPNEDQLTLADVGLDPAHLDAVAQKLYAVPAVMTPQEQQMYTAANAVAPILGPDARNSVTAQFQNRISQATAQAQQNASNSYDKANAVVTAPDGQAFNILNRVAAPLAAKIQTVAKQDEWTPEQIDQASRTVMEAYGNATHRYSGRETSVGDDGVLYDKASGSPLLGAIKQGVSNNTLVSAAGRAANSGLSMINVPNGQGGTTQVPSWQAAGFPSYEAFKAASLGVGQGGTVGPQPGPTAPTVGAPGAPGTSGTPVPGAPTGNPNSVPAAAAQTPDPVLRHALSDPTYKLQLPTAPVGSTLSPDQQDTRNEVVQSRTQLLNDAQAATDTASQSLQYLGAARAIMNSHGTPLTGTPGVIQSAISKFTGGVGVNASNYQEVAKNLANSALQNARQTYGNRMTQSEVGLQLNELNPSLHMAPQAISDLINENVRNAQYTLASAQRVRPYLAAGNDPQAFAQWQSKYWPRADVVNSSAGASSAGGSQSAPVVVTSPQQAQSLKPGQWFKTPDGRVLQRGGAQ